jgi:hypothetical protein
VAAIDSELIRSVSGVGQGLFPRLGSWWVTLVGVDAAVAVGHSGNVRHHLPERVRRRLRSLAALELVNIPLQATVWFGMLGLPLSPSNVVGFAAFAMMLAQGSAYWTAKLRQLATGEPVLPGAAVFAFASRINPLALLVAVLFTGWSAFDAPGSATFLGLGFAVFAVLEQVNYFHTQLSYDNAADLRSLTSRGLRRAHLAADLQRHHTAQARSRA